MFVVCRLRQAYPKRHYSTILCPDSSKPLSSIEKSRAALSLIKTEKNPERILEICRAASLTPLTHIDRVTFSHAISKLSKFNHFEGIRQFLEELKTRPDLRNERYVSHAIVLYGQADMLDHAIRSFKEMDQLGIRRSAKSLNALLFAGILAKNYKEVSRIYLEFPRMYEVEPNLDTYNTVIKAFCESGSSSSVYSVLAEMDRKSVSPNATTFNTWIAGFYKEEKFEEVGKVLDLMKKHGIKPGLNTYNIRIQSLCKLKRSSEAKALLNGMISMGRKPNSVTYSQLIHGLCRDGHFEEAKKLFEDMKKRGFKPDSNCYFTLVYFLCQCGDFETALLIAKESMGKDWIPVFSTMKKLVNGLVSISKVDEAKDLVKQIKEKFTGSSDKWNEIEAALPQ
ncbi:pentatricopeptide repeat-containing protein At1g61870, mitochondrial-like [Neltuma alba]|uniref:pentatricopeptide repeat-containing protein At1g61870, mitochondrial-like n=1 Tax=Neltuma alba TaxID=207710 RepID=UPI0010A2E752|nr:pentatricopeptide repeat-containing protein At1g61870, mitochondrial-like [Prosopis alba]